MSARFTVEPNGCGGWRVERAGQVIGSECSHQRNAQIKADRLNGLRDADGTDWPRFYGA